MNHTVSLKANQRMPFKVNPKDANGSPALLDAAAVATVANPAICSVTRDNFGTYFINAVSAGSTTISVDAQSYGAALQDTINVTIQPVPASTLGIVFEPAMAK